MLFRSLVAFAAIVGAFGQTTNTNAAISDIVSNLDVAVHHAIPTISFRRKTHGDPPLLKVTLQANHTATDGTVGTQVNNLIASFNSATAALAGTAVSSGSTTDRPTNDDVSIVFSDVMQQVASGLSGLTDTVVPTFTAMISRLDPAVAATTNQLNTTLPGAVILVHRMMLDAQQFLVREGAWPQTLAALGF
ncbi:hypothetical protein BDZ94DRAFT_1294652 [Collybia nuda]|uniref:Uncharacterized protein n=1 Tax=Collybia nuda TaxID=64659 RepID=A0A9P5YGK9_9AGAR|nr:hypothetical protein BDZ94DRAFT_1294652 [Collybia nuda]